MKSPASPQMLLICDRAEKSDALMEQAAFSFTLVKNLAEAQKEFLRFEFDMVVVALSLPTEELATCKTLKAMLNSSTQIVALSGKNSNIEALQAAGIDAILTNTSQLTGLMTSWGDLNRLNANMDKLEGGSVTKSSESILTELVDSLPTQLYIVNEDYVVEFANHAALMNHGFENLQPGIRFDEFLPDISPEDGPIGILIHDAIFSSERGALGGIKLMSTEGKPAIMSAEVLSIGKIGAARALVMINDVTNSWRTNSLRQHEADKLNLIVDSMGAGLATFDEQLHLSWANKIFVDWFGAELGANCHQVFSSTHSDCRNCAAMRALSTGEHQVEMRHRYEKDGKRLTFQERYIRVKDPEGNSSVIVLIQDTTTQTDTVEQLRLATLISRAVQGIRDLDELLHVILTCVTTGHALGFNRAFLFLRNKRTNTLDAKMAVGPANAEEVERIWSELSQKQESFEDALRDAKRHAGTGTALFELVSDLSYSLDDPDELAVRVFHECQTAHITDAPADLRISPSFQERFGSQELVALPLLSKGRAVGVLIVDNLYNNRSISKRDLEILEMFSSPAGLAIENAESFTDLRESLGALKRTRKQLVNQAKLAAIGRVAAHVAHEIRNPLTTIGGFAHTIRTNTDAPKRVQDSANIIYDEVHRLERLLSDIMRFSSPSKPVRTTGSLNKLIESDKQGFTSQLDERFEIVTTLAPDLKDVAFDSAKIHQVLWNLISNAMQACGEGGGRIELKTANAQNGVELSVVDNGPGIPLSTMERIFEPFFTTKPSGTGLGLTVSRQLITDHQGELIVSSKFGEGTSFTIFLPFSPIDTMPEMTD